MTALNSSMTLAEVTASRPSARRALFSHFHIGGCRSCAYSPEETLEDLAARNSLDAKEIISAIEQQEEAEKALWMAPEKLAGLLDQNRDGENPAVILLDIRTREEHEAVRIPSSSLLDEPLLQKLFAAPARDQMIVLYDHTGDKALELVSYFLGHGFSSVQALKGGIDAYSIAIDPSLPRYSLEFDA